MRKLVLILGILVILAALVAIYYNHLQHTPVASTPEVSGPAEALVINNLPSPKTVAKADGYQLIVGANPRFNQKQVFLPPTNSLVITNGEMQLRQLIEQSRLRQDTNSSR